ncbi:MAG: aldo/keto reductase [Bacteroidia bacterium]|nr:aldo/keto reductase [Bacteroidia bacterium]
MEYIQVQHAQIPALGLGTYQLIGREAREVVQRALAMGYRHIDTASIYENEAEVGSGLNGTSIEREDVWITTKVWHTNLKKKNFLLSVEESLRKLGCGYLDMVLIHWPSPEVSMEEMVNSLIAAQEKDYTRFVGVSNFPLSMVEELVEYGVNIVTNQVEYHPYLDQSEMREWLRARGMALTAYSPLAQGKIMKDSKILDIAEDLGKTPSQVVLRWLLDQGNVIAIPKSSRGDHLRENLQIATMRLTKEHHKILDGLARPDGRIVNPDFAPQWD